MKKVIWSLVTVASFAFGSVYVSNASIIKVDFIGQIGKSGHVQFFIDADNNSNTGYSRSGNKIVSGADYLIEDGVLFKRKNGVRGWSKGWKKLGHIKFQKSAYNGVMFVPKSKVSVVNGAKFMAYALPKNWANSGSKYLGTGILRSSTQHKQNINSDNSKQIFIVGDSTVNYSIDFKPKYQKSVEGWGEELSTVMKNPSHVYNGARYGASAKSYRTASVPVLNNHNRYSMSFGKHRNLTWQDTKSVIQHRAHSGDYLFIQFGSGNDRGMYDSAQRGYERFAIDRDYDHDGLVNSINHINDPDDLHIRQALIREDFKKDLKYYIDQAKVLHIKPVLISSINPRWYRPNGIMRDLRKPFTDYVREVAQEEGVLLLDLHQKSIAEYNKYQCGDRVFRETFGECHQMDIDTLHHDVTHLNKKGAKIVAGWVKELACQADQNLCSIFN